MAMLHQSFRNVAIRRRVAAYRAFYEDCHGSEERDHYAGRPDILNEGSDWHGREQLGSLGDEGRVHQESSEQVEYVDAELQGTHRARTVICSDTWVNDSGTWKTASTHCSLVKGM